MPFAGYTDFDQCVSQNRDKDDPDAYCGSIKHKVEDKAMPKQIPGMKPLKQIRSEQQARHSRKPGSVPDPAKHGAGATVYGEDKPMQKRATIQTQTPHKHDRPSGKTTHAHPTRGKGFTGATASSDVHTVKKAVNSASYVHQAVRAAITVVVKGHDPVKEAGKKKLTAKDGVANEGAQDDQPFAVAFGPDNYDKLTKTIIAAPYQEAYNAAGAILKALENKQFNFPGNIEEALKKAHAAVHGREMWDARYGDVCDLITRARKILHSIEKTAEVSQGGSGVMVMGKADPVSEKPKFKEQAAGPKHGGRPTFLQGPPKKRPPMGTPTARTAAGSVGKAGDYKFPPGKPPARPKPKAGVGNLPPSGFAQRGAAYKAVRKAVQAVRGR